MSRKLKWNLVGGNIHRGHLTRSDKQFRRGFSWLSLSLIIAFGWLMSRSFFLQVVLGAMNRQRAENNRIDVQEVQADRGVIVDRQGEILARNGLNPENKAIREYPVGETVAHVVGYVGNPSAGVEKSFDDQLRGEAGEDIIEENAVGQTQQILRQKEPVAGRLLKLTIDKQLSEKIGEVLREREKEKHTVGAVVVSRVENGSVLALVSWPSFRYENLIKVLGDNKGKPLFNRAISGAYPPGSVFKLISAVAGLEEKKIDEGTIVTDTGEIKIGEYRYGNWYFDQYGRTEGGIGVVRALARSNDVYFYKVGEWVGIDKLEEWAKKFGLAAKTGIDLPAEMAGTVPDRMTKERLTGERWFLGNTYHVAIGQGDTLVTPLQVNMYTGAMMTGKLCKPNLIFNDQGTIFNCRDLGMSQKTRELILDGMKAVCSSGGTAFPFFGTPYKVACKTGTAQHGGEKTGPHAWITLIIPRGDDYQKGIAITVLLEEAGEGSEEAGPVARQIGDYLVDKRLDFDL